MKVLPVNLNFQHHYGNSVKSQKDAAKSHVSLPIKAETNSFSQDIEYRKNLLKNSGLNPADYNKLRSIAGPQEIKSILKAYDNSEKFYSVGTNDENIKSGFLRANLHIHTKASDGALSVEELLDNAAKYADEAVKKQPQFKKAPFTIAITDHDTTESAKKAIKIIASDPEKYKNLRVILGTEMTTYNDIAKSVTTEPTNTHVLAYGIDPNENTYSNFINGVKIQKLKAEREMIKDANALGKNIFSLKESKEFSNALNKNILGICNQMDAYTKAKYVLSEMVCKNDELKEMLKQKNLSTSPDKLMASLSQYSMEKYGCNKPINIFNEFHKFIQNDKAKEILSKEYQKPEHRDFLYRLEQSNDKYYQTFKHDEKVKFLPKFDDLYNGLEGQPNAMVGLAHPLKNAFKLPTVKNQLTYLTDFYNKFMSACREKAKFSEVYYQSYFKNIDPEVTKFLNQISKLFNLFRTGSADTHGKNIFKRF